jgi:hypothetical protein
MGRKDFMIMERIVNRIIALMRLIAMLRGRLAG